MQGPEQHRRVKELFLEACEREGSEQAAYLDAACAGDVALRQQVEDMLATERRKPEFLEDSPAQRLAGQATAATGEMPERIGPFRIVRSLGEGGMGQVFEAEQDDPRRRVALKVMRPGLVLPNLLKRFEHEKSVLARLHHPGIALLFEAGTAEIHSTTQPFFAMEFVDGEELMTHVRSRDLPIRSRLEIFVEICDAVHHAHQKGVVHRDLKPANILVDADGRPKVLDFGIARLKDSDVRLTTLGTGDAQIIGTLPYMSPEQAIGNSENVDARSDVYSLGVILYELLTDRLPYDLTGSSLPAAVRIICEREPRPISSVIRGLQVDLQTIAIKALEKEKERRYLSCETLAADVLRYLRDEPIEAQPTSNLYKFAKFARRNKRFVGAMAGLMLALVAGIFFATKFAISEGRLRAQSDRLRAQSDREAYRRTINAAFLQIETDRREAARTLLDATKPEFRDWEWRYLSGRIDTGARDIAGLPHAPWYVAFYRDTNQVIAVDGKSVAYSRDLDAERWMPVEFTSQPDEDTASRHPIAVSADGSLVLTKSTIRRPGEDARTIAVLWGSTTGTIKARFDVDGLVPENSGTSKISPTGTHVALGTAKALHLYEVESGRLVEILGYFPRAADFSGDGNWLAYPFGGDVRFWDVPSDQKARSDIRTTLNRITELALSPDRSLLALSARGTIQVWDLNTNSVLSTVPAAAAVYDVAFSADGHLLIAISDVIRIWAARTGTLVRTFSNQVRYGAPPRLGGGGRFLVAGRRAEPGQQDGNRVRIFEVGATSALALLGHNSPVMRVAFSPDGNVIASASADGEVRLWDAETGRSISTESDRRLVGTANPRNPPRGLSFDPSGTRLVLAARRVEVWEAATGENLRSRPRHPIPHSHDTGYASAFSPDGSVLLLGRFNRLGVMDGQTLAWRKDLLARCGAIEFAPDGEFFATAAGIRNRHEKSPDFRSIARSITVFRTRTLAREFDLLAQGPVVSLRYSHDGSRIASGDSDGYLTVWDPRTRRSLGAVRAHRGQVFDVTFLSARRIASSGEDGIIRIWDVPLARGTGGADEPNLIGELVGHAGSVFSLALSPDGERLVSGSADGTVRIWETQSISRRLANRRAADRLRSRAEHRVGRLLAAEGDARRVAERIRAEVSGDRILRREMLHAVFRRSDLEHRGLVAAPDRPGIAELARPQPKNKVLALNGDHAVSVDFRDALDGLEEFTLECWVRGDPPLHRAAILSNSEASGFAIFARGKPRLSKNAVEMEYPWGALNLEAGFEYVGTRAKWSWREWTHVAICYDGAALDLYVNGARVDRRECAGPIDRSEEPFYVGCGVGPSGPSGFFKGFVDEVRLSSIARYHAPFRPATVHEPDDHTLLLLHFDAEVRGFHPDASDKRHHARPLGTPGPRLIAEQR